jgi:hypothetical protein
VITVPEPLTVNVALLVPNFTAVAPVKLDPLIATDVPTGPLVGVKLLIVGGIRTLKAVALVAVPPGVLTAMAPVVAPAGTVAVICVALALKAVAFTPLNATTVAADRLLPLIVTDVPTRPLTGEKPVIEGAGPVVTANAVALVAVPPAVVTAIGPVVAPAGTVAAIRVAETTL